MDGFVATASSQELKGKRQALFQAEAYFEVWDKLAWLKNYKQLDYTLCEAGTKYVAGNRSREGKFTLQDNHYLISFK